jgi:hypothetical protein
VIVLAMQKDSSMKVCAAFGSLKEWFEQLLSKACIVVDRQLDFLSSFKRKY